MSGACGGDFLVGLIDLAGRDGAPGEEGAERGDDGARETRDTSDAPVEVFALDALARIAADRDDLATPRCLRRWRVEVRHLPGISEAIALV